MVVIGIRPTDDSDFHSPHLWHVCQRELGKDKSMR